MAGSKRISIGIKILTPIMILVILGNILSYTILVKFLSKSSMDQINMDFTHVTAAVSEYISTVNERERVVLESIANIPMIKDENTSLYDKSQLVFDYFKVIRGNYIDMCILDTEGNAYVGGSTKIVNFSERNYYKEAMKGNFYIENPFINKVTNAMAIFYSLPVYNEKGEIINVIFSVSEGFKYCELMNSYIVGADSHPYIFDNNTGVIVGSADKESFANLPNIKDVDGISTFAGNILAGETGIGRFKFSDSSETIIGAYTPIKDTTWSVIATAPLRDFNASFVHLQHLILLVYITVVIATIAMSILLLIRVLRPLKKVNSSITDIAHGDADLTQRIQINTRDEIGNVVNGFNKFVEKLHEIIVSVKESKEELSSNGENLETITEKTTNSISEIIYELERVERQLISQIESVNQTVNHVTSVSGKINSLDSLMSKQVTSVSEASGTVESMISSIASVGSKIEQMSSEFETLLSDTRNGSKMQEDMNLLIKEIEKQSQSLEEANIVIAAIAGQTNLLAMNAAIEAAHAGESGKGFSVVADEIRKLSETSTIQSKTIGEQLSSIQTSIKKVVEVSEQNLEVFNSVITSIKNTNNSVVSIRTSIEEQEVNSSKIENSLGILNETTKSVYQTSEQMQDENRLIQSQIEDLENATSGMKSGFDEMGEKMNLVKGSSAALDTISDSIKGCIEKIGSQIDLFKV